MIKFISQACAIATTMMEAISTARPSISIPMVLALHPFHSFSRIPHTLLKVTFSDMSMLHEKQVIPDFL